MGQIHSCCNWRELSHLGWAGVGLHLKLWSCLWSIMLFPYLCQARARSAEMGKVIVGFVYENCKQLKFTIVSLCYYFSVGFFCLV